MPSNAATVLHKEPPPDRLTKIRMKLHKNVLLNLQHGRAHPSAEDVHNMMELMDEVHRRGIDEGDYLTYFAELIHGAAELRLSSARMDKFVLDVNGVSHHHAAA
jgi:hypothetical protein